MTAATTTTWTCDRCGSQEELPERDQPAEWHSVLAWSPPLMAPNETHEPRRHLCPTCCEDFGWFMARTPRPVDPASLLRTEPIGDIR